MVDRGENGHCGRDITWSICLVTLVDLPRQDMQLTSVIKRVVGRGGGFHPDCIP